MKQHFWILGLLLSLLPALLWAQNTTTRSRVISYNSKKPKTDRKPEKVSTEEYQAALERLDNYLEKIGIVPEEVAVYDISDSNRITLQFSSSRPDTTFFIPDEVNFSENLISDYSATQVAMAEEEIERVNQKMERANKKLKRADRKLQRAQQRTKHNTTAFIDTTEYKTITLKDDVPETTVKTLQQDRKGKTNVAVVESRPRKGTKIAEKSGKGRDIDYYDDDDDDDDFDLDEDLDFDDDDDDDNNNDVEKLATSVLKSVRSHYYREEFRGHWAAIELGFNWLLSPSGSLRLSGEQAPMQMNLGSAIDCNVNFMQYSIPFWRSNFGIYTGLGTNFNHYRFRAKNTMVTGRDGIVFNNDLQDVGHNVRSSRFFNWSLTVPLMLELQHHGEEFRNVYFAAGVLLNVRLLSSTKVIYDKSSELYRSDSFHLNDISFAPSIRLGIGSVRLFANFYPMGLFESGKGPKVYPLETGIVFSFID